jgi:hypothetical protein
MNIKNQNKKQIKNSENIIENGENSFKLWLEFEETSPWNDLENDFANIGVDTMDGRYYGVNIWTFKYLATNQVTEEGSEKLNYIIPPDLFVKTLTRDCVEKVIKNLLNIGSLEEILNESIFNLNFIEPYWCANDIKEKSIHDLMEELKSELLENHVLYKESIELIARKTNNDDIVLELENGKIAVVHLTWNSHTESKGFPITRIFDNKLDFWKREMKQEIIDYNI